MSNPGISCKVTTRVSGCIRSFHQTERERVFGSPPMGKFSILFTAEPISVKEVTRFMLMGHKTH